MLLNESSVQFGEKVASNMAMVESRWLQVSRNSVSWQPHSSTTSENVEKLKMSLMEVVVYIEAEREQV